MLPDKAVFVYTDYGVAWTNSVCPCLLVTLKGTKVTGDVAAHCPPAGGGEGSGKA